ncbi:MAG TPA: response regulator [Gemmatimonadaceae bacterium]|nr:response regulator [Gemmatimonadaceae bacterium]
MTRPAGILAAGIPAEIVREIGLRLAGVTVREFEDTGEMARAAAAGEARLVILSDVFPAGESIDIARRGREANAELRVVFCISMAQAEAALRALQDIEVDRYFLAPVDVEEMLRELGKMCGVDVLAPHVSHGDSIAAAVVEAWDRARDPALQKVDKLDDAAIDLLGDSLSPELRKTAETEAKALAELASRFGFQRGSQAAREIGERLSSASLSPADGLAISEQLLALRESLSGAPQRPAAGDTGPNRADLSAAMDVLHLSVDSPDEAARVLVVDDEPMVSRGLASLLGRRGMTVTTLNDPLRFWSVLDEAKPNLVLLDLEMPKISGTELCRVVRNDRRWSGLPVIFLTGHTDHESVRRVFAAGADDYVGKPFVPAELMMRIESRLSGVKVRRGPVDTDPVTGLPTAARATELIERFLKLARRKSDPYSIGVLEIDEFAELTRTHGRRISEVVLRGVGELLPKSFRAEDVVGWWGGAEFTIGMYGSSKENSALKLTQICATIGEQNFQTDSGQPVRVQCSGGVAEYKIDGDSISDLREQALDALNAVRHVTMLGANRIGISGTRATGPLTRPVDVAIVDDDVALAALLRHALESRTLSVASFRDGEEAVKALTGDVPAIVAKVILLDLDLPALNGLEVLRRLKAADVMKGSKVVILTARSGERDVLSALELGAIDHITKPFSVPVLVHKVQTALRQSQL